MDWRAARSLCMVNGLILMTEDVSVYQPRAMRPNMRRQGIRARSNPQLLSKSKYEVTHITGQSSADHR